jgi:hypothetical protein
MQVVKPVGFILSIWLLSSAWVSAKSDSPDVGLVTKISGEITCCGEGTTAVQVFMKVRSGDRFNVPEGGSLQLLYFEEGRQETWKGPLILIVGAKESRVDGSPQAGPEVKYLPPKATRRIPDASFPPPGPSLESSGVIQTMAPLSPGREERAGPAKQADRQELGASRKLYRDMRKAAPAEDLTPEIYYLGVLADHKQYKEMRRIVASRLKVKLNDPILLDWKAWIDRQIAQRP